MSEKRKSFWIKEIEETDRRGNPYIERVPNIPNIIRFSVGMLFLIILVIVMWPARVIGPTERGVVKTFGEVQNIVLEPGLRFRVPIAQKISTYDLTPTEVRINIPVGVDGALSRDRQTIGIKGSYNWKIDETAVIDIARRFASTDALVRQTNQIIITAIKNVVGRYDIANIVQDQVAISNSARQLAVEQLASARIPVEITALNLNNWDWSEDYDRMIRRTIEEQQAVLRASAEADRVEQENRQRIIQAEAEAHASVAQAEGRLRAAQLDAQAAEARAQGEANAARLEGQGIRDRNQFIAQNQALELEIRRLEIQLAEANRWDGRRIPTYIPLNPAGGVVTLPVNPATGR